MFWRSSSPNTVPVQQRTPGKLSNFPGYGPNSLISPELEPYPPAPRRGATRLRGICSILYIWPPFAMESYYSLAFFAFSHFGSSEGSISHFSCLMSHVSGPVGMFTVPKKGAHRPQTTRGSGSGMTPESYENSSIFELVSKATKAMKIGPKATQNHEKSTLES